MGVVRFSYSLNIGESQLQSLRGVYNYDWVKITH